MNKLAQLLINKGMIKESDWDVLQSEAAKAHIRIEDQLVKKKIISEKNLANLQGELFGLPFIDLEKADIPREMLTVIPQAVAENYELVLFEKKGHEVKIALVDPSNYRAIEAIDFWAKKEGYKLSLYITTLSGYRNAMKNYVVVKKEVHEALDVLEQQHASDARGKRQEKLVEIIRKAPVAKIVALMIQEAVDLNTSDIHIEPGSAESRIRFRIDGMLKTYLAFPTSFHTSIVSRIKVLADLKIDETRIPQDGRIRMNIYGQDINLRVSTLPLIDNEKVVMRILPTASKVITLQELGFWSHALDDLNRIIARPTGVLLVSGPTGSGKSTTLYSLLTALNNDKSNITTLEDPVEYFLSGVNQVQISTEVGLTFASGLRAILRQDPNIVMVGDIRDNVTAELSTHAALTCHFMLSTIHAKDVLGVIPRLIDMHVEPFLISAALNTIIAQRLVRKLCDKCKEPQQIPQLLEAEVRKELDLIPQKDVLEGIDLSTLTVYQGRGCEACNKNGYKGRTVVSELLAMTENLTQILSAKFSLEDLSKEMKIQEKMTLKQDAIVKALKGLTSIDEFIRVTRE
ncbi:Flp pilus assembly complex ATPase component TadA [Candidatus Uhrbacteria bacterium]|nr:Flp pilus assembly complex ATPase component TadA [Candidatus Uhrbacteria bacterium]